MDRMKIAVASTKLVILGCMCVVMADASTKRGCAMWKLTVLTEATK